MTAGSTGNQQQFSSGLAVPIYRLLRTTTFDSDTVELLATAFEDVCRELGLAERTDPLRDTVARKVIEIAVAGGAQSGATPRAHP